MTDDRVRYVAIVAGLLLVGMAGFQIALALGLPLGEATFGGRADTDGGTLSGAFRIVAILNAMVLLLFAWIVLLRAGIVSSERLSDRVVRWATWAIVAFMILNTLGNFTAPHPVERWGAGTTTLVLVVLCGIVAVWGMARSTPRDPLESA